MHEEQLEEKLLKEVSVGSMALPEHMRVAAVKYHVYGQPPGDFLRAVLCNDLVGAAWRADDTNIAMLVHWAHWLHNILPHAAWGSQDKVEIWCGHHGLTGF